MWHSKGWAAYLAIYHESQDILNVVKGKDLSIGRFPQSFPICVAGLNRASDLVDEFGIGHANFQERILCVVLKAVDVLAHQHGHVIDDRLMLGNLHFEVPFEWNDIFGSESNRSSDVDVVLEVSDVKHDRVALLGHTK